MGNYCHSSYISLLVLSIITLSRSQTDLSITEPRLVSVTPINSTALTLNWQFADPSVDQSDLIKVYITFYEIYYSYNAVYSTNYTFTTANKTITNLTINFQLVNAYYYVCFSSNSTITNVSQSLSVLNTCKLSRTCQRGNVACPGPSTVGIFAANILPQSFVVYIVWPNDLPYSPGSFSVQLKNNSQAGVNLGLTQNNTYTTRQYRFDGLKPTATYVVNATFTYTILFSATTTNVTLLTVMTSSSSKLDCLTKWTSDLFLFSVSLFLVQISK